MRNLVIGLGRTRAKGRRSSGRLEGCKEIGLDATDAKGRRSSARLEGVHGGCMRNLVISLGRTRAKGRRSSARVEGCKEIGLGCTSAFTFSA